MSDRMIVSENHAVELLAFLITAARGLIDEPSNYGPLRLLDAAERLSLSSHDEASTAAQDLFATIIDKSPAIQGEVNRTEQFKGEIDSLCRTVAHYLVDNSSLEQTS